MPRRQQRGAGIFDFLSSDPSKKKEANLKKIGELEKDSENKCEEIKKTNAAKIEKLNTENLKLDGLIQQKNAEPKSSGFDLFGIFSKGEPTKDSNPTKKDEPKVVEEPKVEEEPKVVEEPMIKEEKPMMEEKPPMVGNRMFGGKNRKSQRRRKTKARKSAKK